MTIAEMVRGQFTEDHGPVDHLSDLKIPKEAIWTENDGEPDEHDYRNWHLAFGMAFALARAERPFAPISALCKIAEESARLALADYQGLEADLAAEVAS